MNSIFDPKKNIKPWYKDGDGYKAKSWPILDVISLQIKNNQENQGIVKQILDESIQLFQSDTNNELVTNFNVLITLFDILVSKPVYVDDKNLIEMIDIMLKCPVKLNEDICLKMNNNFSSLVNLKPETIQKAFSKVLNAETMLDYTYYINKDIESAIRKDPFPFFDYSIKYLTTLDHSEFYNLGALINYSTENYKHTNIRVFTEWLRYSCQYMDNSFLKETVKSNLQNTDYIARKIAVMIATVINDTDSLFENQNVFNDKALFLDLKEYLSDVYFTADEQNLIIKLINESNIEVPELKPFLISKLKKEVPCIPDGPFARLSWKELTENYGKDSYVLSIDETYREAFKEVIKNKSFKETADYIKQNKNHIALYKKQWLEAYSSYLLDNGAQILIDNIQNISQDRDTMISLSHHTDDIPLQYIEICCKVNYTYDTQYLSDILYLFGVLLDKQKCIDQIETVYKSLDIQKIIDTNSRTLIHYYYNTCIKLNDDILNKMLNNTHPENKMVVAYNISYFKDGINTPELNSIIYPLSKEELLQFYRHLLFGTHNADILFPFILDNNYFPKYLKHEKQENSIHIYLQTILNCLGENHSLIKNCIDIKPKTVLYCLLNMTTLDNDGLLEFVSQEIQNKKKLNISNMFDDIVNAIIRTDNTHVALWTLLIKAGNNCSDYSYGKIDQLFEKYAGTNKEELWIVLKRLLKNSKSTTSYGQNMMRKIYSAVSHSTDYSQKDKTKIYGAISKKYPLFYI